MILMVTLHWEPLDLMTTEDLLALTFYESKSSLDQMLYHNYQCHHPGSHYHATTFT